MTPKLRIAEIFSSIQGEGIWLGLPSVFIRVSGCNLRCGWCDTPYASWEPEGEFLEIDEIVRRAMEPEIHHIVLTGGEPMLFEPIVALAQALKARGRIITVETAGTVFQKLPCDLMSISPKLSHSTPEDPAWKERHEKTRLNIPVLIHLLQTYSCQLKFVVKPDDLSGIEEIRSLLSQLPPVPNERVMLMPEGVDSETLRRSAESLIQICLREGWRLAPRYHIDLFGNTRGT